ncbi:putative ABC transporter ATP-binding protein [Arthrobacter ulcerisalmonis]|uniref:Fatty acid ABC transporter ATP-binding/permease protein n=1 Tax=Arthrobacter ulcerisalmonis TaxID=2483813 RepID=A0A3P5WQG2_9MICC|nr:ABC transporter ATP-binding protein [Arthrobacter ulcerisalmonis]VDC23835.1 putative ABC transporter ATP-binding protein [Arthrobacter ulcerisalmonis]
MSPRKKDSAAADQSLSEPVITDPTQLDDDDFIEEDYVPSESDGDMFGGVPAKKAQHFWPSAKRLIGLLKPETLGINIVVALVVVAVVLNVIAPKILGQAMDVIFAGVVGKQLPAGASKDQFVEGLRQQGQDNFADMVSRMELVPGSGINFDKLTMLIAIVLLMYFVSNIFLWLQGYVLNIIVMKVIRKLRDDTEKKLNRLPLNYFDTRQRGDVLSRVTNDVDNVQQALQQAFAQLINSLLTVVGIVIMMFIVSWQLALIALIALPLSGVAAGMIGVRSQKLFAAQWKNTGQLNGQIEESFSGHDLVRVFGRDADMMARFDERNDALYKASFGAQFVSGIIFPVMQFVSYLSYVGIAVVGGLRVASGSMSLGDATAFIQYSREFTQPLGQMAGMANMLQSGVASAERVFEFLDADEQDSETATKHLPAKTDGHVDFKDVTFSYTEDKKLIEDLSFTAEPGNTVAIVGPTGAGKTTLVNLVMRFYELNSGTITLDGVDITQLSRAELRSKVGMVLQDAWLFGGSIYDNIRYGNLEATEEQVMAAAKATFVDRFVRALPDGYETIIDEEGNNVSAGEKQLITIARAFVANPSLLILDEATSSVDTRTELLVQKAMAALRTDRTSFVIAHRLSTIRDADTILVMENGQIVEQGNHKVLLAAQGAYYRLYQSQFAGSDAEDVPVDDSTAVHS